eukprot:1160758-Pelagomonas_calceolata.AAC.15
MNRNMHALTETQQDGAKLKSQRLHLIQTKEHEGVGQPLLALRQTGLPSQTLLLELAAPPTSLRAHAQATGHQGALVTYTTRRVTCRQALCGLCVYLCVCVCVCACAHCHETPCQQLSILAEGLFHCKMESFGRETIWQGGELLIRGRMLDMLLTMNEKSATHLAPCSCWRRCAPSPRFAPL